jgi:hypothetical protein
MKNSQRFKWISLVLALTLTFAASAQRSVVFAQATADLSGIKTYLLQKAEALQTGAADLKTSADAYYALAKAANFDYGALWKAEPVKVAAALKGAKAAWVTISPLYEQIEGIVAGVPVLKRFDPILDSGVKDEVEFDVTLPDGKTLPKPGNLFGLLETSLWGTAKQYVVTPVDLDGNGTLDFGEVLPDAVYVKGFADSMAQYSAALYAEGKRWEPTEAEAFTALVVMVPTMKEYFNAWKESRFIMGDKANTGEFSVISRLADITDIVGSLEVIYTGISPMVAGADPTLDRQIATGLVDLRTYAGDLHKQELAGKKFTPEQADIFAAEAQSNADAITGKIAQVAAQLAIKLEN